MSLSAYATPARPRRASPPAPEPREVDEAVRLILSKFWNERPVGDDPDCKKVWKVLNAAELDTAVFSTRQLMDLQLIEWFQMFVASATLETKSVSKIDTADFADLAHMLRQACPQEAPSDGFFTFVRRIDGSGAVFVPERALRAAAEAWDDMTAGERVLLELAAPWAGFSISDDRSTPDKQFLSLTVTKKNRITLLHLFCASAPPNPSDEFPVAMSGGGIYIFKPSSWVSDIAGNWTAAGKRRVRLDDEEKKEVEKLPWFKCWIRNLESRVQRSVSMDLRAAVAKKRPYSRMREE